MEILSLDTLKLLTQVWIEVREHALWHAKIRETSEVFYTSLWLYLVYFTKSAVILFIAVMVQLFNAPNLELIKSKNLLKLFVMVLDNILKRCVKR